MLRKPTPEPVKKLVVPPALKTYGNGMIPEHELARLHSGGTMYGPAAFWWNIMHDEALKAGIKLKGVSGGYRSYASQEAVFRLRYSTKPTGRNQK